MPLNFTRRAHEKTVIIVPPSATATRITVGVLQTRPDLVKLEFDAPDEVVLDREEIHDAKLSDCRRASATLRPGERRATVADTIRATEEALRR